MILPSLKSSPFLWIWAEDLLTTVEILDFQDLIPSIFLESPALEILISLSLEICTYTTSEVMVKILGSIWAKWVFFTSLFLLMNNLDGIWRLGQTWYTSWNWRFMFQSKRFYAQSKWNRIKGKWYKQNWLQLKTLWAKLLKELEIFQFFSSLSLLVYYGWRFH